jgi:hypothetical protein
MGLSWQQGPLAPGALGRFLVPEPLPKRILYAEPLRRRTRVRFGGSWIADSGFAPGLDPTRGDYASFAEFSDPDGSSWLLQERGYRNA